MRNNSKQCGVVLKLRYISFSKYKTYTHSLLITTDTFFSVRKKLVTSCLSNATSFLDERNYPVMYGIKQYLFSLTLLYKWPIGNWTTKLNLTPEMLLSITPMLSDITTIIRRFLKANRNSYMLNF